MYEDLHITVLEKGGYTVQTVSHERGTFNPFVAAFSTKAELLAWLDIELVSHAPDIAGRRIVDNSPSKKETDDEIPF